MPAIMRPIDRCKAHQNAAHLFRRRALFTLAVKRELEACQHFVRLTVPPSSHAVASTFGFERFLRTRERATVLLAFYLFESNDLKTLKSSSGANLKVSPRLGCARLMRGDRSRLFQLSELMRRLTEPRRLEWYPNAFTARETSGQWSVRGAPRKWGKTAPRVIRHGTL